MPRAMIGCAVAALLMGASATPIKIQQDDICVFPDTNSYIEDYDRVIACLYSIPYDPYVAMPC